jgi:hypothetical protein
LKPLGRSFRKCLAQFLPIETRTHYISLVARKYSYFPSRIVVNKGDTIVLKTDSIDVPHRFFLDGYPIELIIKKGVSFQKYTFPDGDGKLNSSWDRVSKTKFVATRSGKFTYRCTQTCGNLHPFMTGELIVKPNTPYHLFISLSIWVVFAVLFRIRINSGSTFRGFKRINILDRLPWLKRLVKLRNFQFLWLRVRAKITSQNWRSDLVQVWLIRESKTTGIAGYFAGFAIEVSAKDGLKLRCKNVKLLLREP